MSTSIYTTSVPVFKQMLGGLADVLRKAEAHAEAKKIDPNALLQARLCRPLCCCPRTRRRLSSLQTA